MEKDWKLKGEIMFIVLEIQKNDGQVSVLTNNYEDVLDAESKYHTILSFASKSTVEVHTALIMTEYGFILKQEHYEHPKASEPEENE